MSADLTFLAFDLGASSGRAVLCRLRDGRLLLEEVHRFPNGPVQVLGHLHWNVLQLFEEIKVGLRIGGRESDLAGVALSTWGVDSALLDRGGELLGLPYCYRDDRTAGIMEKVFTRMPREEIFTRTGIQFMPLNTLYQLYATKILKPELLRATGTLLMMPDLFVYWLAGRKGSELTIASTTQFLDAQTRAWSQEIFDRLELPFDILPEIYPSGSMVGELLPEIADEAGLRKAWIVAPASHDTASAVASVPASVEHFAYISSGTWSALGVLVPEPVINQVTLDENFTNECGLAGRYMLRKNIMGLWPLQECRRIWAQAGQVYDYADLVQLAEQAAPFGSIIEPDHESFLPPGDMPARIAAFCRQTGQEAPAGPGAITRCILESLALKYRFVLDKLEKALGWRGEILHIVGGGSKNRLLCAMTASATGRPVLAGPSEATTLGNAVIQARALGAINSLEEGRQLILASSELERYEPREQEPWESFYARYLKIKEQTITLL